MTLRALVVAAACACGIGGTAASASEYSLLFSHDLDVWSWDHSLGWNQVLGKKLIANGEGLHSLKLAEVGSYQRRSSVTKAGLKLRYPLGTRLTLGSDLNLEQSHLKAGNEVSDVISRRGTFVTLFDPLPALHVNGGLGGAYDERRNVGNGGVAWNAGVRTRPLDAIGLGSLAVLSVSANHDAVESEQGDEVTEIGVSGALNWSGSLHQSFTYDERRDAQNYVSTQEDNAILSRIDHVRQIATQISTSSRRIGTIALSGNIRWGAVSDDASDDSTSLKYRTDNDTRSYGLSTSWSLPFERPAVVWAVDIKRGYRDADPVVESDSTETPNYLDRRQRELGTSLSSTYAISSRDTVSVSGTLRLERDHTPSADEVNDRDDYTRALVATYRHRFTHGTATEFRVERTETHQVWLNAARSANNKWDRALNLWAITRTQIGNVGFRQRTFFKAQLEEFDFDYLTPDDPRSRNARIAKMDFTGDFPWRPVGTLTTTYSIEARTRGVLLPPDNPGERPTLWQLTRNELAQVLSVELTAPLGPRWTLNPEASVSRQRDYEPTSTTWNLFDLGDRIDSQDTIYLKASCIYQRGESGAFSFTAARTYRRRNGSDNDRTSVTVTYQHIF